MVGLDGLESLEEEEGGEGLEGLESLQPISSCTCCVASAVRYMGRASGELCVFDVGGFQEKEQQREGFANF